jgi:hypothetical protein
VQTKKNLDYKQRAHIDIAHNQSVEIIHVFDREYPCRMLRGYAVVLLNFDASSIVF